MALGLWLSHHRGKMTYPGTPTWDAQIQSVVGTIINKYVTCKTHLHEVRKLRHLFFALSHKGSNLDSSGPKPDVLPITP